MRRTLEVVIAVIAGAGHAHAQSSDASASADQLFKEGRALAQANRWAEACPKFEASLRHDRALGTLLNIAACHEQFGRLASAWSTYQECVDIAGNEDDRRRYAEERAAALKPRLPRLTILAQTARQGLVVMRNGTRIDPGALGVALYVDPGPHEITASMPGFEPFLRRVTAVEARSETLVIPDLRPLPGASTQPNTRPRTASNLPIAPRVPMSPGNGATVIPDPVDRASRTAHRIAIGAGALGVAALGTSLVFKMRSDSAYAEFEDLCPGGINTCTAPNEPAGQRLMDDAKSNMASARAFAVVGSVGVGAAVLALVLKPSRQQAVARLTPTVQGQSAGLAIMGRF